MFPRSQVLDGLLAQCGTVENCEQGEPLKTWIFFFFFISCHLTSEGERPVAGFDLFEVSECCVCCLCDE